VSVDLATRTLVVSRNSRCPSILRRNGCLEWLDDETDAVGVHVNTKPSITQYDLEPGMSLFVFSDGIWAAGARNGERIDLPRLIAELDQDGCASAESLADGVLAEALRLDQQRAHDDATVAVITVRAQPTLNQVRRLALRFPIG
jgi:serine phosphatase RsbU (regulator of sigma subunit)